ncbi:MAG TPA: glycosyltransferase [Gammaproteobacteria bacterium]|nr:glycosyltransferase [Gammaproteobacteria bacterium]
MPLVSIVMSVYNGESYLREAIESILNQTFTDFEFIIINDGSTDTSAEIVRSYNDERIRLIQQENIGLAAALNRGIELSEGKYIARMDADDICYPNRLEVQFRYLERHQDIIALGSAADWIDESGQYLCTIKKPFLFDAIQKKLPDSPFIHPSVMFRRKVFYAAGRYPERFRISAADAVLFNKMAMLGELRNLSEPLICYRVRPDAASRFSKKTAQCIARIVDKAIHDLPVHDKELAEVYRLRANMREKDKRYEYHLLIAKKLLWDNPCKDKARTHILAAMRHRFFSLRLWALLLLSFLPKRAVQTLYRLAVR